MPTHDIVDNQREKLIGGQNKYVSFFSPLFQSERRVRNMSMQALILSVLRVGLGEFT